MIPPERRIEISTRQPASGSARWCSTPPASIEVEGAAERAQLHDVGLRIAQIRQAERARLALRIAQAGQAEIDRERVDVR